MPPKTRMARAAEENSLELRGWAEQAEWSRSDLPGEPFSIS